MGSIRNLSITGIFKVWSIHPCEIPDSPWQGRAPSSERGFVECRQPTCTEQTGCAILDEWSANRKLRRLAQVRGSGCQKTSNWVKLSVRWESHYCALAIIEPCHLRVAFLQPRDGDVPSPLALP